MNSVSRSSAAQSRCRWITAAWAGAAISIAVVRLPAGDPASKIGSIFFNPAGPGGSGVDFLLFAGPYMYTEELRMKFDLVGFAPRGIARSTALRCFGNPKQWTGYFTPFSFPITPEEEELWEAADRYLDDACAQRGTKIIDYMSTANVARDLDLLRHADDDQQHQQQLSDAAAREKKGVLKPDERITEQQLAKIETKEEPARFKEESGLFADIQFDFDKYDIRSDA